MVADRRSRSVIHGESGLRLVKLHRVIVWADQRYLCKHHIAVVGLSDVQGTAFIKSIGKCSGELRWHVWADDHFWPMGGQPLKQGSECGRSCRRRSSCNQLLTAASMHIVIAEGFSIFPYVSFTMLVTNERSLFYLRTKVFVQVCAGRHRLLCSVHRADDAF